MSLRDMGQRRSFLDDQNTTDVIYGSTPYSQTAWDADIIHGCLPDVYGYYDDHYSNSRGFVPTAEGMSLMQRTCTITLCRKRMSP